MKPSESKIFKLAGLQCDAEGCDYINENISADDYAEYVNKPCPRCGSPLLTEADFNTIQDMLKFEEKINELGIPLVQEGESMIKVRLDMNGSSKVSFKDIQVVHKGE